MKKVIISAIACLWLFNGFAQSSEEAVIAASKMNVLYRGVDNPVEIAVPGLSSDKLSVSVSSGTIKKVDKHWTVAPGEQSECIITVSADNKAISSKHFRVKEIPAPALVFAGKKEGSIPKALVINTETIGTNLEDFIFDLKFSVVSFTVSITKNGFAQDFSCVGNKISPDAKKILAELNSGENFYFENVKVAFPDGTVKMIDSAKFTIQ